MALYPGFYLLVRDGRGWRDSGEGFDTRAAAEQFIAAECDPERGWQVVDEVGLAALRQAGELLAEGDA